MATSIRAALVLLFTLTTSVCQGVDAVNQYGSCVTPENEQASCVEWQDCKVLATLITQNLNRADRNYLIKSKCGVNRNKILLCCPERYMDIPSVWVGNPVSSSGIIKPVNSQTPKPIAVPFATPTINNKGLLPTPPQCGKFLVDNVIGGTFTNIDEFPWIVLLSYLKANGRSSFKCAGSLINNRYVVTAAHCMFVKNSRLTSVRLGEWNLDTDPDCEDNDCASPHINVAVESTVVHPSYVPSMKNQTNDIALIRLAQTVTFSQFVRPVCLPLDHNMRSNKFEGRTAIVTGWGETETASSSNIKLKAMLTVRRLEQCKQVYKRSGIDLKQTQLCAGGQRNIDSCRGDSGGPLVVDELYDSLAYYYLVGIVSFGPTPCGMENVPGVYTRVGPYVDWIQQNIRA